MSELYELIKMRLKQKGWDDSSCLVEDLHKRNQQLEQALLEAKTALEDIGKLASPYVRFISDSPCKVTILARDALASISALNLGEKETN